MSGKYKAIIIGAGPAGLSAALSLKKQGVDGVLVIERFKFPRYKCCAGYITNKTRDAYARCGLDVENINYSLIRDFNIFYRLKKRQNIQNKFLFTNKNIDRVELDNAFYELAKACGVDAMEDTTISEHNREEKYIVVSGGQKLYYENLIFADGTTGYGERYKTGKKRNIAMQLVFESDKKEEIQIHFGITKNGYGWVSSFGGVTNVGITDVYNPQINYQQTFGEFLEKLGIEADIADLRGAFTPIGISEPILDGGLYYVGDAVGACDPLTLSGLRYALASGEVCAKAIAQSDDKIYLNYIKKLKVKFSFMEVVLKLFYLKFSLFCVFNIGCRFFGRFIAWAFNNLFVSKK